VPLLRKGPTLGAARPISLALQGGGAHGAFQWGLLDRLLEYGELDIQSISAASAGAMNAVCLVSGMLEGGTEGARAKLESFWRAVSQGGSGGMFGENVMTRMATDWFHSNPVSSYLQTFTPTVSPYDFNPLNLNPLREILKEQIDFKAIREQSNINLFIAATAVRTSQAKLFHAAELTPEHILASACLPDVFQAVEIDGVAYWDGGYLANPPIWPLVQCRPRDILLLLLNPIMSKTTPRSTTEIMDRLNELSFNASLLAELRTLATVQDLINRGLLKTASGYLRLRFHMISADKSLHDLKLSSKANTDWSFLQELMKRGRAAADAWLMQDLPMVGERSSVDLGKTFL
jgi:NTE family protein